MKTSYLAAFAVSASLVTGCAGMQPISEADKTIERVVEAPNYSKDQIFSATKIWVAENFKSAKSVIEYENKEEGTIIGNGVIAYPCSGMDCLAKSDWKVPFTMRVDMKNEKFKLTFTNMQLAWPASVSGATYTRANDGSPIYYQGDIDKIKPALLKFGDELQASMNNNKKSSNW